MQTASIFGVPDLGRVLLLCLLLLFVATAQLVIYMAGGYGMYRIALQHEQKNRWLGWVPIGRYWLLGALAQTKGKSSGRLLKWGLFSLSLVSFAVSSKGLADRLAANSTMEFGGAFFVRLWLGSPLHAVIQVLLALGSAWAVYKIMAMRNWENAALWASLCIPFWFLRWILIWAASRKKLPQAQDAEVQETTQEWLQALAATAEKRKGK